MKAYLLDTGPLIAALDADDQHHGWALETLDALGTAPLFTCEAVLSEAWFLARRGGSDATGVLGLLEALEVDVVLGWSVRAAEILRRYAERASVADAALLALAEADDDRVVVTTDRKDFMVYRLHQRRTVPALMPPP